MHLEVTKELCTRWPLTLPSSPSDSTSLQRQCSILQSLHQKQHHAQGTSKLTTMCPSRYSIPNSWAPCTSSPQESLPSSETAVRLCHVNYLINEAVDTGKGAQCHHQYAPSLVLKYMGLGSRTFTSTLWGSAPW